MVARPDVWSGALVVVQLVGVTIGRAQLDQCCATRVAMFMMIMQLVRSMLLTDPVGSG